MPDAILADQVIYAMRRLAALGETSVSPQRIADLVPAPRPSFGAVWKALEDLWEAGRIDHARVGVGRWTLAPEPVGPSPVQESLDVGGEWRDV